MEWTRTETLALASPTCTQCHGHGLRLLTGGATNPCNCVLRAIFRACYNRFRYCATKEKSVSRVSLEYMPQGGGRRSSWGRKDEEYCADFLLIAKRTLTEEEHRVFTFHFLLGADWRLCTRKMKLDRGLFFHCLYRIQQKLGKVFRELEPYALFPLDEYFNSTSLEGPVKASNPENVLKQRRVVPIRPGRPTRAAGDEMEMEIRKIA